ncbi:hypothetical protein LR002_02825 [Candidatus Gracilibacteria bacterium]|nr:hypothetical protein [Candidatus Gracilibacteria bacterium]
MYRPRPPKKSFFSYFLPFLIIISIIVGIIFAFQSIILKKEYFKNTFATLNPGEKGTYVMLSGTENWNFISKKIKLFKGDIIKTSKFASIDLLSKSKINLDKGAIILIDKLQSTNSSSQVKIVVPEGRVWFLVERMINPESYFKVKSGNMLLSTKDGVFSVNGNSVRVIEGGVDVEFFDGKKVLGKMKIGVGQELVMSDSDFDSLKIGTLPSVRAINDEFKLSSWYEKNYLNNGKINETSELKNIAEVQEISSGTGKISEKTSTGKLVKAEEKVEKAVVKKAEHKGEITLSNEDTNFEIFKDEIVHLSGKVPSGTNSVKVNGWKLGKFIPGKFDWRYNGALKWKNLKEGENIYKVEVFDEDGIKFAEKEFKINVKIKEEPKKTSTGETIQNEEKTVKNTSDLKLEQTLQIISHKDGEFVKLPEGQALEIKGIASSGATKIQVGDYVLKSFKKGDKNFIFRIAEEWGNAKVGEENTYKITSLDEDGNEIETIKFHLFIEK